MVNIILLNLHCDCHRVKLNEIELLGLPLFNLWNEMKKAMKMILNESCQSDIQTDGGSLQVPFSGWEDDS